MSWFNWSRWRGPLRQEVTFQDATVPKELPETISDLAAWYDSRTSKDMALSGSNITGWNSRSGSLGSAPLTQASGSAQPIYATNVPLLNGKNGVEMSGSQLLQNSLSQFKFVHQGGGSTILALCRVDGSQSSNRVFVTGNSLASSGLDLNLTTNTNNRVSSRLYNSNGSAAANALNGDQSLGNDSLSWFAWSHITGTAAVRTSGRTVTQADASAPDTNNALPNGNLSVGFGSGTGLKGHLCQLLVFTRVLSDAEVEAIAAWFAREYNMVEALDGARTLSGSNYFACNVNQGVFGAATGFWIEATGKLDSFVTSNTRNIARHTTGGSNGWQLTTLTTNATLRFGVYDGSGAFISVSAPLTGYDLNKVHTIHGVFDGSAIYLYIDGLLLASTPCVGYTVPNNTSFTTIGNQCDNMTLFGFAGGHAVPTFNQIRAHHLAIRNAGRTVAMTGVQTDHLWHLNAVTGSIADQIGNHPLNVVGAPTLVTHRGVMWRPEMPDNIAERIPGLVAWFDPSSTYLTVDGLNRVSNWVARAGSLGAVSLVQATDGLKPIYAASDPVHNGKSSVQFDGKYLDALVAGDWAFMHNGGGCTICQGEWIDSSSALNMSIISTTIATASNTGWSELLSPTVAQWRIANGSGTYVNNWGVTTQHITRGVARYRFSTYVTGSRGSVTALGSASQIDTGGAPSSSAPTAPIRVGNNHTGNASMKGSLTDLCFYNRVLTTSEQRMLADRKAAKYGVAA